MRLHGHYYSSMRKPYKNILLSSVMVTAILFGYDYSHDPGRHRLTVALKVLEGLLYGAVYILLIFGVGSLLYFLASRIKRRFSK